MALAENITDFTWGERYDRIDESGHECHPTGPLYLLSGSGTSRTAITVQTPSGLESFLEFSASADETNPARYETYPYDFSVEAILHYIGLALRPVKRVNASGVVTATANLATGAPVPDGLPFTLTVTWPDGGIASYAGASSGGTVGFQLALPETAFGKTATFVVSHPGDGTYQEAVAPKALIKIAKPKVPPPSPCELAERRVRSLTSQLRRLKQRANRAYGKKRRKLKRRARAKRRALRNARLSVNRLCP
jgi:hypothetical protein